MDNELEVIRHQMEEKRASLADKLDALENEVMATVHEATAEVSHIVHEVKSTVDSVTEGVHDTVESVKETLTEGVQETVATVKQTLNVNDHIRQHPWMALGGAFAAGFAGGYLLGPSRSAAGDSWSLRSRGEAAATPEPARSFSPPRPAETSRSWTESARDAAEEASTKAFSALEEAGGEALGKVKELAVGTLMGVLGHMISNALPNPLKDEASKLVKDLTTKLGGKVLDVSPILEGLTGGDGQGECQDRGNQADWRRADAGRAGMGANDRSAQRASGKEW